MVLVELMEFVGILEGQSFANIAFQGQTERVVYFQGVVGALAVGAVRVEVATEPAGTHYLVGTGTGLPDIHRAEVRTVGIGIAHRVEHGQLALVVEAFQSFQSRV